MSANEELEKVFSKLMTRKQFLQHIGFLLLSIFGVNALVSRVMHSQKPPAQTQQTAQTEQTTRWGNGKFGV